MTSHVLKRLAHRGAWTALAVFLVVAISPQSGGQIAARMRPDRTPEGKEPGVYVKDSATASDKFELAKRMERLKEWHKSADVYQEILRNFRDPVVPTATDNDQKPITYSGVTLAVRDRLCQWPEEGLAVYRTRFEPAAAAMLDKARADDPEVLQKILNLYFVTETAKKAGIRLMDLNLEGGDFAGAAWVGELLLQKHPTLGRAGINPSAQERAGVLFRTAIAYHLSGSAADAAKHLADLKATYPNEQAKIGGRDVNMVVELQDQLQRKAPIAASRTADSWRTFGGDETRNLMASASVLPTAQIYSIDLTQGRPAQEQSANPDIMPVIDRGELFFQDGLRVFAVHLESGVPLPGWQQSYSQSNGQYIVPVPARDTFPPEQPGMQRHRACTASR